MPSKYGDEVTNIGCTRVQVGTAVLPDGTVEPVFELRPNAPDAYRRFIKAVTGDGHSDNTER